MIKNKDNVIYDFICILPEVVKTAPKEFFLLGICSIFHAAFWFLVIEYNQKLYDCLIAFVQKNNTLLNVCIALISVAMIQIVKHILNGIANYIPIVIKSKINQQLTFNFNKKISKLDPILFEQTEFLDNIQKANRGKAEVAWNAVTLFTILTFYIPYFIFLSAYLFSLKPILVMMIIILFIPIILTQFVRVKIYSKTEDIAAPIKRENAYYKDCIVDREYLKETRMLGGVNFFLERFQNTLKQINILQLKADKKASLINLGLQLASMIGYLGVFILLFISVFNGSISIGAFTAVFQGIGDIYKLMEEVIYSYIGGMIRDLGYIKNYTRFMRMSEKESNIKLDSLKHIIVNDVSFKYPGKTDYALRNINLEIKENEVIAIVGVNGSGKTTLMRLLAGIYEPESGSIEFDGVKSTDASPKTLYTNISAVFQNYQKYMMSLKENITISNLSAPINNEKMHKVCVDSRVEIENSDIFPNGDNTMLSREFNGIELSGGQWQRIAIARGLYKNSKMIILDEPTAAIDPIEESNIYSDFITLIQGNIACIVTHRLGSVRLANRIIVLDNGVIVGNGTHDDLLRNCSYYKQLYDEQRKWYV